MIILVLVFLDALLLTLLVLQHRILARTYEEKEKYREDAELYTQMYD